MFDIKDHDSAAAAPGDLELVQRFMNLHEHVAGLEGEQPPSTQLVRSFLVDWEVLTEEERFIDEDREAALELIRALKAKVRANGGEPMPDAEVRVIDEVAQRAGLHPHFGADGPVLVPQEEGVAGAFGHIVAAAFMADLDGSWAELKQCASEDCHAVFFDRSKNHSGRWCSMERCGNRAKVRAWRERHRAQADG